MQNLMVPTGSYSIPCRSNLEAPKAEGYKTKHYSQGSQGPEPAVDHYRWPNAVKE